MNKISKKNLVFRDTFKPCENCTGHVQCDAARLVNGEPRRAKNSLFRKLAPIAPKAKGKNT